MRVGQPVKLLVHRREHVRMPMAALDVRKT
jgi:hypothetical protein